MAEQEPTPEDNPAFAPLTSIKAWLSYLQQSYENPEGERPEMPKAEGMDELYRAIGHPLNEMGVERVLGVLNDQRGGPIITLGRYLANEMTERREHLSVDDAFGATEAYDNLIGELGGFPKSFSDTEYEKSRVARGRDPHAVHNPFDQRLENALGYVSIIAQNVGLEGQLR